MSSLRISSQVEVPGQDSNCFVKSNKHHQAEEHVYDVNSELQKEAAENEREMDEFLTLNELRKSRRETREPNWPKDYCRGKSGRKH
ncbi:hypothetical protein AgCh_000699 [Apium graveolens]